MFLPGNGIDLKDPDNNVITSAQGKSALSRISFFIINKPKKGIWSLVISKTNGAHEFNVMSTSNSNVNIDFSYFFIFPLLIGRKKKAKVSILEPVVGRLKTF